jgi:hypothetical protein
MGAHIKTTLDITAPLLDEVKRLAAREHVTLRVLVEEGLRAVIAARGSTPAFRMRDARFHGKGRGLHPAFAARGYEALRDAAYEGDEHDGAPARKGKRTS